MQMRSLKFKIPFMCHSESIVFSRGKKVRKLGCMLTLATSPASKITFHRGEFFQMTYNALLTTSKGSK